MNSMVSFCSALIFLKDSSSILRDRYSNMVHGDVIEEEVVFTGELDFEYVEVVGVALDEDLGANAFEGADFLGGLIALLQSNGIAGEQETT